MNSFYICSLQISPYKQLNIHSGDFFNFSLMTFFPTPLMPVRSIVGVDPFLVSSKLSERE